MYACLLDRERGEPRRDAQERVNGDDADRLLGARQPVSQHLSDNDHTTRSCMSLKLTTSTSHTI
jgi:hypothetical protein